VEKSEFYRRARSDSVGPLDGIRLIEATTTWAGPMCGCLFADLGAEVIKVEAPRGEIARRVPPFLPNSSGLSFMHATVNRNKKSLTLDLRRPEGRDVFLRLARGVDVVVENFRPGTLSRWGLGYEQVRALAPGIVYVSISGYGQFGPDHERAGYDPIAQAASGWLSMNGEPGGDPVKAPTFIGDDIAGLHAAFAALAALRWRDRTGEGQYIDVALLDALLFQSNGYPTLAAEGAPPERLGNRFQVAAPAGTYRCRDGWVLAGVMLDTHWKLLARLMGVPELADDPELATAAGRIAQRERVDALLSEFVAERSKAEVVALLLGQGLPVSAVRSYSEAAEDPHVRERDMLQEVELEDGSRAPLVGPAAKFSRTPTRVRSAAPALGRDNDAILGELGIGADERERLRREGVI
jgi:formyl-CoA transferase